MFVTEDVNGEKLCEKKYDADDLTQIKEAIEDLYYFEFVIGQSVSIVFTVYIGS